MKPIEIVKGIYWVGAVDWNLRDFHGYATPQGTTYNAYLILDEKVTLIDTVKKEFADHLLDNIAQIIDPKKIDYVISNHTEMDHSGGLPRVMHKIGEDKPLYCSKIGQKNLSLHFPEKWNYQPVENGGILNLGKRTLTFLETRMLHWPDSMFSYVKEEELLFSSDAFGQHYAGPERFDDQIGEAIMPHARKYFANILLLVCPPGPAVGGKGHSNGSGDQDDLSRPRDHVATGPGKIIKAYVEWSQQKPKKKAVIVYDTMWQSTQKMAEAIVDGLCRRGLRPSPCILGPIIEATSSPRFWMPERSWWGLRP